MCEHGGSGMGVGVREGVSEWERCVIGAYHAGHVRCKGTRALNNEIEEAERQREERNTERVRKRLTPLSAFQPSAQNLASWHLVSSTKRPGGYWPQAF